MPSLHPSAIIDGDVDLHDSVTVGPHCVITGPVTVGAGTRLIGNVYLQGPLTIGADNTVYPFACIGFSPQSLGFDHEAPGIGTVIGDRNRIREHVTIHRAMTDHGPTRLENDNYLMAYCHMGHDVHVGNNCIFANSTQIGGHVRVFDRVVTGGNASVHQFCQIGRCVMVKGNCAAARDVPPYCMMTDTTVVGSLNLVGMRRSGMTSDQIDEVRWIYRIVFRSGMLPKNALELLRERADRPIVQEYIEFMENSKRGICGGRERARTVVRGAGAEAEGV